MTSHQELRDPCLKSLIWDGTVIFLFWSQFHSFNLIVHPMWRSHMERIRLLQNMRNQTLTYSMQRLLFAMTSFSVPLVVYLTS
jgi:hypothetical protein